MSKAVTFRFYGAPEIILALRFYKHLVLLGIKTLGPDRANFCGLLRRLTEPWNVHISIR